MQLAGVLRETADRTMRHDFDEHDLAVELAHFHVNKALGSADNEDWTDCVDQLYRASHLGGRPYWELYRWLTQQLEMPTRRAQFGCLVPRDSYYRATG